ncbi:MAG: PEP-CTERM sorting domain-containing protein [Candidatus Sulfotelmatobacter sp.]
MTDPENGNVQVVAVRRRRTSRHRRNRRIRRWLAGAVVAVFSAGVSILALQYLSPSLFRPQQSATLPFKQAELSRNRAVNLNQMLSNVRPARPVYPYSVVPGGVANAKELKWVAEHDPVVAAHYAGFDYDRAQLVRLTLARTVYVSYRIGNRIYWTRRRLTLHKGETLITDGRMMARTRCANRVEEAPQQQAASPVEPPLEKFEEPLRAGEGTAVQGPPVAFESALLNRPGLPGFGPLGPLSLYDPFSGGGYVPNFGPPLTEGVCAPVKKKKGTGVEIETDGKKKISSGACGSGGGGMGTVPEPGTWLLFASGLVAIYWMARRKLSRA